LKIIIEQIKFLDFIDSGRAKDLRLGGCKGIFSTKFRKTSEKRTENFLLLLEKVENFSYWGGGEGAVYTSPHTPASAAPVYRMKNNNQIVPCALLEVSD
jgi:hypothetical protein